MKNKVLARMNEYNNIAENKNQRLGINWQKKKEK